MVDFSGTDRKILQTLQMPDDTDTYYTPLAGGRVLLPDVIFRSPDEPVIGQDLVFEGVGPMFTVHRDDCPNLAQGDTFERTIPGTTYTVKTVTKNEGFLWVAHCRLT